MELSLIWNDIKSSTMIPDAYVEKYATKADFRAIIEFYTPREDTLNKIRQIVKYKSLKLKILAIGADWCPDCSKHIPEMIKIVQKLQPIEIDFRILYGVKVNALRKKGEPLWSVRHSPPEATNPKFNLTKIPTFYIFGSDDILIGTIVEHPKHTPTIEEELLYYISN